MSTTTPQSEEILKAIEAAKDPQMTPEEFDAVLLAMAKAVGIENISPQDELKHRLNLIVQDIDPGKPVHWRGL